MKTIYPFPVPRNIINRVLVAGFALGFAIALCPDLQAIKFYASAILLRQKQMGLKREKKKK